MSVKHTNILTILLKSNEIPPKSLILPLVFATFEWFRHKTPTTKGTSLPDRYQNDPGECTFCRIAGRQLPAEILVETGRVISILDINPIHFGHALVIPRSHCADFLSIAEPDLREVMDVAQRVARGMVNALGLEGFNVFSNNGRIAGQSVFHFHLHITPRYPDDDIRFVLKLKSYRDGEMATYADRIRQSLLLQ